MDIRTNYIESCPFRKLQTVLFPFSGAGVPTSWGFVFPFSSEKCSDPLHCDRLGEQT